MLGTTKIIQKSIAGDMLKIVAVYDNSDNCGRCLYNTHGYFSHLCQKNAGNCSTDKFVWVEDTRK